MAKGKNKRKPEPNIPPPPAPADLPTSSEDDLRFAPRVEMVENALDVPAVDYEPLPEGEKPPLEVTAAAPVTSTAVEVDTSIPAVDYEPLVENEVPPAPDKTEIPAPVADVLDIDAAYEPIPDYEPPSHTATDGLDIEAALAAVSTLSDMVAEQEAAEQARLMQVEADAEARAERQARIENPERFFAVPPMTTLQRGQLASVLPAIVLMLIGAWLTLNLTTTQTTPDNTLVLAAAAGGATLIFLARWIATGRWSRGSLFMALTALFGGGLLFYLTQSNTPGLANGWPLLLSALGIAIALTGLLGYPADRRLLLPGLALIIAGIAGLVITAGMVSSEITATLANLWPAAVLVVVVLTLLPVIFRQRQ